MEGVSLQESLEKNEDMLPFSYATGQEIMSQKSLFHHIYCKNGTKVSAKKFGYA